MRYVCGVWDPSSQTSSFIRCAHTKKRNGRAAAAAGKKTCSWNNVYQSKAEAAHSRLILSSRLVLNMKWTVKIERCAYTSCGFRSLLPVLSFHFAHRFGSSCFKSATAVYIRSFQMICMRFARWNVLLVLKLSRCHENRPIMRQTWNIRREYRAIRKRNCQHTLFLTHTHERHPFSATGK